LKAALEEAVKVIRRFERQTGVAIVMLQIGDVFPSLTFARVGGGEIHSAGDLAGALGVILFHRAFWYGFCNAQLTAFARAADKLGEEDIKIVSVSVDDREKSEALFEQRRRGFPVAYGADARAVSAFTSAFVNDAPVYLQATGFVPQSRRTDRNGGLFDRRDWPSDARQCAGSGPHVISSAKNRGIAADWRGAR
jgi:peroxiredoxin